MSLNIDQMIIAGDVEIQHRVRRYDVEWGRPHFAVTYKRLVLAKAPIVYWSMEQSEYSATSLYTRDWGTAGRIQDLAYVPTDGTGLEWDTGQADPTDDGVNFNAVGYAEATDPLTNSGLSTGYSIVLWVKPNVVLANNVVNGLLCKQQSYGTTAGGVVSIHMEGYQGVNRLAFHFNDNEVVYTPSTSPLEVDKWYCITLTVQPGGALTDINKPLSEDNPRLWSTYNPMHIYLNGVVVYNNTSSVDNTPDLNSASTKWMVGATRQSGIATFAFDGSIDEVGVFPTVFNEFTVKQIYGLGLGATYLEPDEDFDNDVVGSYADQTKYSDLILSSSPSHYWSMDTILTGGVGINKYVEDKVTGVYARNLVVAATAGQWSASRVITSPLSQSNYTTADAVGKALAVNGDDYSARVIGYQDTTTTREQTIEFWYMRREDNSHFDGIVGTVTYDASGFQVSVRQKVLRVYFSHAAGVQILTNEGLSADIVLNTWYHIVATVSSAGEGRLYMNGQLIHSASWGAGFSYSNSGVADLMIGGWGIDPNNTQPIFNIDELALYPTALTASEVYNHYYTALLGPYAKVVLTGGDPLDAPSPFVIGTNEYSQLTNEEDITEYVDSYTYDADIKQIVATASMTVYEDWGAQHINTKLNANTYVKIDRRFMSQSLDYDSGWVSLGHFLCEGPIGSSFSTSGQRVSNVSLKGLTKLLALDSGHTPIEPDRLFVRKRKMDITSGTAEYTKYYMSRNPSDPSIDNVLYNWVEQPSTKIWVTDFLNVDATDETNGGISDPKEVIRIKGSDGAVRVLGGEGAITIDNTYRLDKVSENGLGNPGTVLAELYRYATVEDKVITTVSSITAVRNKWQVDLTKPGQLIDGKSFFVKSGTAKGKLWKLIAIGYGRTLPATAVVGASTVLTNQGSQSLQWTLSNDFGGAPAPPNGTHSIQATFGTIGSGQVFQWQYATIPLTVTVPTSADHWSDDAVVTGITVNVTRRTRTANGGTSFGTVTDGGMLISLNGINTAVSTHTGAWSTGRQSSIGTWELFWENAQYGGEGQTLGTSWTWGQIKDQLTQASFLYAVNIADAYGYVATVAEFCDVTISLSIADGGVVTLHDIHGYPVNPEYEGLAIGDLVQVGDYNAVEDAVRKALYRGGFQENDSTLPFYFELDACPTNLAPSVPPARPQLSDQTPWLDIIVEMLQYAPPNYRVSVNTDGTLKGKLVGFIDGAAPTHTLVGKVDINEDHGDYGVTTRVIIEGEASDSFNIALNVDAGGTSAVRAYTLNNYVDPTKQPEVDNSLGITVTQDAANLKWQQVFNGNPKTPVPSTLSSNKWNNRYGVILAQEGLPKDVKRWTFEDLPLCVIDIGRSASGTPIEVEAMEFTWFNHYLDGNTINQSLIVHYMTEAAYEAEFGVSISDTPNQDDMGYMPPATANSWQLLLDEFSLSEGNTTLEVSDFEGGLPVKARFFKFTCGQAHYRFPVTDVTGGDIDAAVRVTLSDCKIWTSKRIVASAELGVSGKFSTGNFKQLATRLRRRTNYLAKNLYLNDYGKARSFAVAELEERYVDFTPVVVTAFAPTVEVADIVYMVHPETRVGAAYLVVAVSHDMTGVAKLQILNYEIR